MKCDVIYAMVCACCWGLLCIGCTKEDFVFSGNGGGGEVEGENGGEMVPPMVSSDAASFFNFAIFFDGRGVFTFLSPGSSADSTGSGPTDTAGR